MIGHGDSEPTQPGAFKKREIAGLGLDKRTLRVLVPVSHRLLLLLLSVLAGGCLSTHALGVRRSRVDRSERLETDGARLFLQMRGADRCAPVLLWLHGGPGGPERPLFRYFNDELEDHFVVVYWDQRGAGISFDPNADPGRLTVRQHLADLDAVVERLRGSLGRNRIALIGHSWGAALGLLYVQAHPDKVSAFIAVAPLVSMLGAQQAQYAFVAGEASRHRDGATLDRLERVGPPPHETADEAMTVESLADKYGAVFHKPPHKLSVVLHGMLRGLVKPWEIARFIHALHVSLEAMHEELLGLDLERSVPEVQVPVFFFLGRYDRHVDAGLSARYFAALRAPMKQLIWFENSAHNVPFEEPDSFNAWVVRALQSPDIRAKVCREIAGVRVHSAGHRHRHPILGAAR